jgi:hypothetical protein
LQQAGRSGWRISGYDNQSSPRNPHRFLYHIPHSLDPRQFLASMSTGKVEAEVGLFDDVNAWETHRWWFTESELIHSAIVFGGESMPLP